jgi:hypothetical protein
MRSLLLPLIAVATLGTSSLALAAVPGGACSLLTDAEVKASFPGAGAGVPDNGRAKYGILSCDWATSNGRVMVEFWKNDSPTTARTEMQNASTGSVEPSKPNAQKAIHYQDLPNIGDSAVAAIARQDQAVGVTSDLAVVIVVTRARTITIYAPQLANLGPVKAIATLTSLARSAAGR